MNNFGRLALLAAGIVLAQPAQASDKQDFVNCDGLKHPGKKDDGMRGEASRSGFSFAGLSLSRSLPGATIAACTTALASPRLLSGQGMRRAHLLRARAIAYLQAEDPAKALADLDLADTAVGNLRDDPFFKRSMGVSMLLLRALAKAQSGEPDAAHALAREAAEARPYALPVQYVAASVMQHARPIGAPSPSPWGTMVRLEPAAAATALNREAEVGNFAGVLALRPAVELTWPEGPVSLVELISGSARGASFLTSMEVVLDTAYAHAVAGDAPSARGELAELDARIAQVGAASASGNAVSASPETLALLTAYVAERKKLVEARIAVVEGRHAEAIGALVGARLPNSAATLELIDALKASAPTENAALIPETDSWRSRLADERGEALSGLAQAALIAPETHRAVIDYERARPNILGELVGAAFSMGTTLLDGIDRKDGFRSATNPDGTIKVEFIGNTPSAPMVQEMTLLRAAELAQAAGKAGFVIVDRSDYSRTLQMSRGGVPISSTPQGFKTELTIRLVDAAAEPERAFDALAVIDALGPLYYEAARPRVAAR